MRISAVHRVLLLVGATSLAAAFGCSSAPSSASEKTGTGQAAFRLGDCILDIAEIAVYCYSTAENAGACATMGACDADTISSCLDSVLGAGACAPGRPGPPGVTTDPSRIWQNQGLIRHAKGHNFIVSPNWAGSGTKSILILQPNDGNLVLYSDVTGTMSARWASGPFSEAAFVEMQTDGNLVMYDRNHLSLWDTQSFGSDGCMPPPNGQPDNCDHGIEHLVLQEDGNLVLYSDQREQNWDVATGTSGGQQGSILGYWHYKDGRFSRHIDLH